MLLKSYRQVPEILKLLIMERVLFVIWKIANPCDQTCPSVLVYQWKEEVQ